MLHKEFSSIQDENRELFVDTGNGDWWLEEDGVLVKQGTEVDARADPTVKSLYEEFESPFT